MKKTCKTCGAGLENETKHDLWHRNLDELIERALNAVGVEPLLDPPRQDPPPRVQESSAVPRFDFNVRARVDGYESLILFDLPSPNGREPWAIPLEDAIQFWTDLARVMTATGLVDAGLGMRLRPPGVQSGS